MIEASELQRALRVGLRLKSGSRDLRDFNVELVRGYLERNLGCSKKEVVAALGLNPRTVTKAINIIRGRA